MSTPTTPCRLYLITPPAFDPVPFADTLAAALDAGDVGCLQLRLKDANGNAADGDTLRRAADALRPVAQDRGVAFLMNDHPELARELDCDGVHIGQEDATYEDARKAVGPDAILGMTCHDSRHLAIEAAELGADYVAFGAFYPTTTKNPKSAASPELLSWWREVGNLPSVAIGGITVENAPPLIEAGADFLAVVSGVWDFANGPAAAVKAFDDLFKGA